MLPFESTEKWRTHTAEVHADLSPEARLAAGQEAALFDRLGQAWEDLVKTRPTEERPRAEKRERASRWDAIASEDNRHRGWARHLLVLLAHGVERDVVAVVLREPLCEVDLLGTPVNRSGQG